LTDPAAPFNIFSVTCECVRKHEKAFGWALHVRYHKISDETIRRLPVYLRDLLTLSEQGRTSISSNDLAALLGVNPWQIRKDFSYFGDFGTRGVGYDVENLIRQIKKILRLSAVNQVALVGVGNLGTAVMAYPGFKRYGFEIVAAFDSAAGKVGRRIGDVQIEDVAALNTLQRRNIHIAAIAVPRDAAQEIADALVEAGIKGILNFSPCYITVPKKVKVITIDIAMDLARLPYYLPGS